MNTGDLIKIGIGASLVAGAVYLYNKYLGSDKSPDTSFATDATKTIIDSGRDVLVTTTKEVSNTIFGKDNTDYPKPKISPVTDVFNEKDTLIYSNNSEKRSNFQYDFGVFPTGSTKYIDNRVFMGLKSNQGMSYQDVKTPNPLTAFGITAPKPQSFGGGKGTSTVTAVFTKNAPTTVKTPLPMSIAPSKKNYFGAGFSSI